MLNVSGCRNEHAANLRSWESVDERSSVEKVWPIRSCGAIGKRCEPGESIRGGKRMIEGEGQKQGRLHSESAKQEENGERVDFI